MFLLQKVIISKNEALCFEYRVSIGKLMKKIQKSLSVWLLMKVMEIELILEYVIILLVSVLYNFLLLNSKILSLIYINAEH